MIVTGLDSSGASSRKESTKGKCDNYMKLTGKGLDKNLIIL